MERNLFQVFWSRHLIPKALLWTENIVIHSFKGTIGNNTSLSHNHYYLTYPSRDVYINKIINIFFCFLQKEQHSVYILLYHAIFMLFWRSFYISTCIRILVVVFFIYSTNIEWPLWASSIVDARAIIFNKWDKKSLTSWDIFSVLVLHGLMCQFF